MEVRFKGEITEEDIIEANVLLSRPTKKNIISGIVLLVIGLIFGFYMTLTGKNSLFQIALNFTPALIIFIGFFYRKLPSSRRRRIKKWIKNRDVYDQIHGTISENQLEFIETGSESKSNWDLYRRAVLHKDIVLLFLKNGTYRFMSRRYFDSDNDWKKFLNLVEVKLPIETI